MVVIVVMAHASVVAAHGRASQGFTSASWPAGLIAMVRIGALSWFANTCQLRSNSQPAAYRIGGGSEGLLDVGRLTTLANFEEAPALPWFGRATGVDRVVHSLQPW